MTVTFVFFKASAISEIALICGTPTPATIRVVHMLPGPIPTFTQSAPALARSWAAFAVAILPAIISRFGKSFLVLTTRSITP